MKTSTYVLSFILTGDPFTVEGNIEMLVSSLDYTELDSVEIVVRNESEDIDE